MAGNVVVLASGETERRSLPHLVAHLRQQRTTVDEVRTSPNGTLGFRVSDEIQNPKLHLKHLLAPDVYTARVSEEISRTLAAVTITHSSPSFRGFLQALLNGGSGA